MTYRHALRVSEVTGLNWDQVDLGQGKLHVNRLKNEPSVHYLEGDEIRALRKLHRAYPELPFVFQSVRQGPLSVNAVRKVVARAGVEAGLKFSVHCHFDMAKAMNSLQKESIRGLYRRIWGIKTSILYTQLNPKRFEGFGKDVRL